MPDSRYSYWPDQDAADNPNDNLPLAILTRQLHDADFAVIEEEVMAFLETEEELP